MDFKFKSGLTKLNCNFKAGKGRDYEVAGDISEGVTISRRSLDRSISIKIGNRNIFVHWNVKLHIVMPQKIMEKHNLRKIMGRPSWDYDMCVLVSARECSGQNLHSSDINYFC